MNINPDNGVVKVCGSGALRREAAEGFGLDAA
jgi:hypothetical protein